MDKFFASGSAVVAVLALMFVEWIGLILVRKKMGIVIGPVELLVSLSAGAAILLALREALRGAPWQWVALWLVVSLICHLFDLKLRLATRRTG